MFNRTLAAALAAATILISAPAIASPIQPFSAASLQAAQGAGKPIIIHVHADWCPICRAQSPTITAISKDPKFAKFVILKLDFDSQEAEWKALGVRQQSTIIVYKGKKELQRTLGVTDAKEIRKQVSAALR